jgi:hypothetical protein
MEKVAQRKDRGKKREMEKIKQSNSMYDKI